MTDPPEDDNFPEDDPRLAEWNESLDSIFEDGGFDPELGKQMGKDAVLVSMGEMTEAEFYEKYHQKVLDEFGVDDRPVNKSDEDHD